MHGFSFFSYFCKSLNVRIKVRQWCELKGDRRCLNDVLYSKWLNLRWILKQLWCVLCFTAASPSRRFDLNSIKHRFTFQRLGPRNLPPASSNERLHQMNPFSPPLPRFSFVIYLGRLRSSPCERDCSWWAGSMRFSLKADSFDRDGDYADVYLVSHLPFFRSLWNNDAPGPQL